ncbi:hypothetical protein J7382_07405 [Shimia sp. R11_0]|uniref:hypothetical protein n=1 Tax=Shimia sp. R11_0 TaxID=2821096 RepID=UPI001ADCDC30|nr:hypothetical protein [Shimia sp. R11_0]MBO9477355.1 hypothetical protein [Shimia sp. R11_0]
MKDRLKLIAILVFLLPTMLVAEEVIQVGREDFRAYLHDIVDFQETAAKPFPGTTYSARIPFSGLSVHDRFRGQIPVLRLHGNRTFGVNYGAPSNPLEVGAKRSGKSTLQTVLSDDEGGDIFLTSRVFEPTIMARDRAVGFGTIVVRFVNRQFVFGFDLQPLNDKEGAEPVAVVSFFGEDGAPIGTPIRLTRFGRYTFATRDLERKVKGIEFINTGGAPIGIDDVVFELPLHLG